MGPSRSRIRAGALAGASAEFLPSLIELYGGPSTRLATVNNFGDNHRLEPRVFNPERDHIQYFLGNSSRLLQLPHDLPPESRQQFIQQDRGFVEDQDQDTRVAPTFEAWRVDHSADDGRIRFVHDALHDAYPVSPVSASFSSLQAFYATRYDMRKGP